MKQRILKMICSILITLVAKITDKLSKDKAENSRKEGLHPEIIDQTGKTTYYF